MIGQALLPEGREVCDRLSRSDVSLGGPSSSEGWAFPPDLDGLTREIRGGSEMAAIKMVEEEEATGRTKDVYANIKETLGTDFVPNLYKAMGANPAYLEANWNKVKAIMIESTKLDRLTKEVIAVAVAAVNSCDY